MNVYFVGDSQGPGLAPDAHKKGITMNIVPSSQARHIQINVGNVLTIGVLSLLWWGGATWISNFVAHKDLPVISPLAVGAQNFLHAA